MGWIYRKTIHEVERGSNLDLILRAANGVGNRFVDALLAIATALSTPKDNSEEIKALTEKLKASSDVLDAAVKANQPK
jgi:hypothetical protein